MKKQPRLHKFDRLGLVYDDEILPIWTERFGRMILRDLQVPPKASVLDVCCATGYPSLEILRRLDEHSRIIAMDPIGTLVDVARGKAGELLGKRIFFRTEAAFPKLSFADEVYDLAVCNLGLDEVEDPARALGELVRVTKLGGQVRATLALAGSWNELYDLYREVLLKHDKRLALLRLEAARAVHPQPERALGWMEQAGLVEVAIEVERFSLLFRSAEEFFFAPVIEFGPLPMWKAIAGKGPEMQEIFWWLKEAIDAYFGKRPFEVSLVAGCLRGSKAASSARGRPAKEADDDAVPVTTAQVESQSVLLADGDDEGDGAELAPASQRPRRER